MVLHCAANYHSVGREPSPAGTLAQTRAGQAAGINRKAHLPAGGNPPGYQLIGGWPGLDLPGQFQENARLFRDSESRTAMAT